MARGHEKLFGKSSTLIPFSTPSTLSSPPLSSPPLLHTDPTLTTWFCKRRTPNPKLRTATPKTLKPKTRTLKLSNPNPNPDFGVEQIVLRRCVCAASGEMCSLLILRRVHDIRQCLQAKSQKQTTNVQRLLQKKKWRDSERLYFATSPTIADLAILLVATLATVRIPPCH